MKTPSQIIFYTRPWEVLFHIGIAKHFQAAFQNVPVRFVTFFRWAARHAHEAGFEVNYLPDMLSKADKYEMSREQIRELDGELASHSGVGLNLMAQAERFLPRDADSAEVFIKRHASVLNHLVAPGTLSISSMYDHFVYWLGGSLANIREGWHFAFVGTAVPGGRALALKTPWEPWQTPITQNTDSLLEEVRESLWAPLDKRIEYMRKDPGPSLLDRIRLRFGWQLDIRADTLAGSYFSQFTWGKYFFGKFLNRYRAREPRPAYDVNVDSDMEKIHSPFYYIPLHMEPEATILMYSPWLRDQIEMVRLCSQALPFGIQILVKENPKMDRVRSEAFYRALKALPGIKLVAPEVSSIKLIQNSQAVLSLAGSASLEAALLSRPSLVFGRPPFRKMVAAADFSSEHGFNLAGLNSWLNNPEPTPENLLRKEWDKWVSGTFRASVVPRFGGMYQYVDSSSENTHKFYEFIMKAIKDNNILNNAAQC